LTYKQYLVNSLQGYLNSIFIQNFIFLVPNDPLAIIVILEAKRKFHTPTMLLFDIYRKRTLIKVVFFNIFNYTSLQDFILSGICIASNSQIYVSAMLLLLTVGNWKGWCWHGLQWHNVHTKFCGNWWVVQQLKGKIQTCTERAWWSHKPTFVL